MSTSGLTANVRWGLLTLLGIGFLIPLVIQRDDPGRKYGSSSGAESICEVFVERRLKSPGSAQFPTSLSGALTIDSLGEGRYTVRSYVDAQNAFGALLRSRFVCRVIKIPGGDQWHLEDLWMER